MRRRRGNSSSASSVSPQRYPLRGSSANLSEQKGDENKEQKDNELVNAPAVAPSLPSLPPPPPQRPSEPQAPMAPSSVPQPSLPQAVPSVPSAPSVPQGPMNPQRSSAFESSSSSSPNQMDNDHQHKRSRRYHRKSNSDDEDDENENFNVTPKSDRLRPQKVVPELFDESNKPEAFRTWKNVMMAHCMSKGDTFMVMLKSAESSASASNDSHSLH